VHERGLKVAPVEGGTQWRGVVAMSTSFGLNLWLRSAPRSAATPCSSLRAQLLGAAQPVLAALFTGAADRGEFMHAAGADAAEPQRAADHLAMRRGALQPAKVPARGVQGDQQFSAAPTEQLLRDARLAP